MLFCFNLTLLSLRVTNKMMTWWIKYVIIHLIVKTIWQISQVHFSIENVCEMGIMWVIYNQSGGINIYLYFKNDCNWL